MRLTTALFVGPLLLLGGCESLRSSDGLFGYNFPYRIDIVQGNVVTKEQLALLKPGMTRAQVRDAIGTPLLTDPFHADRWDYVFSIRRPGTDVQRRSVVVRFEGDAMKSVEAPELPSEKEFVASISRPTKIKETPVMELSDSERKALPKPAHEDAPPAAEATGPQREYPPLEAS